MIKNELGHIAYSEYVFNDGNKLYTIITLPGSEGKYPVIIMRNPYVDGDEFTEEEILLKNHLDAKCSWLKEGFAVVEQHCRGRGKSEGVFIPFIDERTDGLSLQAWIRKQSFYDGRLFLYGGSYTSAVHLATAPFAEDIKGAVLEVMTTELYSAAFRNGCYKVGLHGIWFEGNYKNKQIRNKNINIDNFLTKPFMDYPEKAFGEYSESFIDVVSHTNVSDPFWLDASAHGAYHASLKHNRTPILFTTGWYDIFLGPMFKMYEEMDLEAKNSVAFSVCPFDHSMQQQGHPLLLKNGSLNEYIGNYQHLWMNAIKNGEKLPLETGKITYYKTFTESWEVSEFKESGKYKNLTFGTGTESFVYDPDDPVRSFKGGLSHNFGSTVCIDENERYEGVLTRYSEKFDEDTLIKGRIKLRLPVVSDCEDTAFYVRLSINKAEGDYAFRDDIGAISYFTDYYKPCSKAYLDYIMEPHCILVKKGERIRIDVSSSAFPQFLPHTNIKGDYLNISEKKVAVNSIVWDETILFLPTE